MHAPGWVVVLAAVAALAPAVAAEHAYSHRYVLSGRVLDASGAPLQGIPVEARLDHANALGGCPPAEAEGVRNVTGSDGAFRLCFHVHAFDPHLARYSVRVDGAEKHGPLDPEQRKSVVNLRLPTDRPDSRGDWDAFNRSYLLTATLWETGPGTLEGEPVHGLPLANQNVKATLEHNGGVLAAVGGRTNAHGDTHLRFEFPEGFRGGTVRVEGPRGESQEAILDTRFHASLVVLRYSEGSGLLEPPPEFVDDKDGASGTPLVAVFAVLTLGILALWGGRG